MKKSRSSFTQLLTSGQAEALKRQAVMNDKTITDVAIEAILEMIGDDGVFRDALTLAQQDPKSAQEIVDAEKNSLQAQSIYTDDAFVAALTIWCLAHNHVRAHALASAMDRKSDIIIALKQKGV